MGVTKLYLILLPGLVSVAIGRSKVTGHPRFPDSIVKSSSPFVRKLVRPNNGDTVPLMVQNGMKRPGGRNKRSLNQCTSSTSVSLAGRTCIEVTDYLNNSSSVWTITTPNRNERIVLMSKDFLLEASSKCSYDYVEIFDGEKKNKNSIGRFCGRQNVWFVSSTGKMTIKFKSDESVTASGFHFELIPLSTTCSKFYTADSGTILSPNYGQGNYYPHNHTCLYRIQAKGQKRVELRFEEFALEEGSCLDDFVTVYNGDSSGSEEIGTYCGRKYPKSVTSKFHYMFVVFHSNGFISHKGFKLSYQFLDGARDDYEEGSLVPTSEYDPDCSTTISSAGQNVRSPEDREEGYYLQKRKCRTTILPPPRHGVKLQFRKFDMEESLDCIYDHVVVTFTNKGERKTVRLCGYQRRNTPCFFSNVGDLQLDFSSDAIFEGSGYEAEYSFIPSNETANVDCETSYCDNDCRGYCFNNGDKFKCACPDGKVPPKCVEDLAWLKPLRSNLSWYAGTKLELSCAVNHPNTYTLWEKDFLSSETEIAMLPNEQNPRTTVKGTELTITEPEVSDGGEYTCTVQAGRTIMSQTIKITIIDEQEHCGSASDDIYNPNSNLAFGTIAGTNASKASDFIPWQVNLWDKSKEKHHCGGVLISETHVLTAAHCVEGPRAASFSHNNIRVSLGTLKCKRPDGITRQVSRHMVHPSYNNVTLEHDFALLELDKPIHDKSNRIYPVCLPKSADIWKDIPDNYRGLIAGCGKNPKLKEETPNKLHFTSVPIANRTICQARQDAAGRTFTGDMFCAGYKEGGVGDACSGDSGGGFVAKVKGRWTLLGLISFGQGCASKGSYGYYANVTHALDWIRNVAPICGRSRFIKGNYEAGRIVHGQEAQEKQFPWIGALLLKYRYICPVNLIGARWAVTARHCVEGLENQLLDVILGTVLRNSRGDEKGKVELRVRNITWQNTGPDVALLKLEEKLEKFTDHIQPVCLPSIDDGLHDGDTGFVAGWGEDSLEKPSNPINLLFAEMVKTNDSYCAEKGPRYRDSLPSDMCLISTFNSSIKAYRGDSGAGFVMDVHGRSTLMAGYKGGYRSNPLGIYIDIRNVLPWIKEVIGWIRDED